MEIVTSSHPPIPNILFLQTIDVINVKIIIINVNKHVYSEKIVNVCKLKVNVHRA